MIDSYVFGHIVVNGAHYKSDIIVFPEHVQEKWWRREGHKLQLIDIQEALESSQSRFLVVGTGKFGVMRVTEEVRSYCSEKDITLHAESTDKAVKMYNRLILTSSEVLGAFHLTC